jgi:DNA-directed RNA polymerase subunit RPC12/RpoP
MGKTERETLTCQHCGAEADLSVEGFEAVSDVIQRKKKIKCKACGREIGVETGSKEVPVCQHCGAEADLSVEGFEAVSDVIKRKKKIVCKACGREM